MKIKAKRPMVGDYGTLRAGEEVEIEDRQARALIKAGLAVVIGSASEPAAETKAAQRKPKAPKAD